MTDPGLVRECERELDDEPELRIRRLAVRELV
jgi:hypothetical protein